MQSNIRRCSTIVSVLFIACVIGFYVSLPAKGQEQKNDLAKQVEALKQAVDAQKTELQTLKSSLDGIDKTVKANAQRSLEWDRALNSKILIHNERFNTLDEKLKRFDQALRDKFARTDDTVRRHEAGLRNLDARVKVLEASRR